jgi:hypothetical protein
MTLIILSIQITLTGADSAVFADYLATYEVYRITESATTSELDSPKQTVTKIGDQHVYPGESTTPRRRAFVSLVQMCPPNLRATAWGSTKCAIYTSAGLGSDGAATLTNDLYHNLHPVTSDGIFPMLTTTGGGICDDSSAGLTCGLVNDKGTTFHGGCTGNPINPTNPTNSTNPANSTNSTNSTKPTYPAAPTTPTTPTNPTNPSNPANPCFSYCAVLGTTGDGVSSLIAYNGNFESQNGVQDKFGSLINHLILPKFLLS